MSSFLDVLHSGRVLLMDGAMGTEIQRAGLALGDKGETWNLTQPGRVLAIHKAYVAAGAQCLLTNTFQALPSDLVFRIGSKAWLQKLLKKRSFWPAWPVARKASFGRHRPFGIGVEHA